MQHFYLRKIMWQLTELMDKFKRGSFSYTNAWQHLYVSIELLGGAYDSGSCLPARSRFQKDLDREFLHARNPAALLPCQAYAQVKGTPIVFGFPPRQGQGVHCFLFPPRQGQLYHVTYPVQLGTPNLQGACGCISRMCVLLLY